MYEDFYGFTEKPFSLTPDPKYLYRSQSHANAFDLLGFFYDVGFAPGQRLAFVKTLAAS